MIKMDRSITKGITKMTKRMAVGFGIIMMTEAYNFKQIIEMANG